MRGKRYILLRDLRRTAVPFAAAVLLASGGFALAPIVAEPASGAGGSLPGAALVDGTGTPIAPGTQLPSTQVFRIALPSGAACTQSTAASGYHVFSLLVNQSHGDPSTYQYGTGGPLLGFGLSTPTGSLYANVNTNTDATIIPPPAFNFKKQFPFYVTGGSGSVNQLYAGTWNLGISCTDANSPANADNVWTLKVAFADSATDPNHFTWNLVPTGVPTTTTITASPNGSAPRGTDITLTATVVASSGSGQPAGTVQFFYLTNGKPPALLGTTSVSNGQAVFTARAIPVGPASFNAVFTPTDVNAFQPSTSQSISYQVTATDVTTTTSTTVPGSTATTAPPDTTSSGSTSGSSTSGIPTASPTAASGGGTATLPFTGFSTDRLIWLALFAIVIGGVVLEATRKLPGRPEGE